MCGDHHESHYRLIKARDMEDGEMGSVSKAIKITIAVVVVIGVLCAAAYGIYRLLHKDYDEDFDDGFDDFDDDYYDDLEIETTEEK